MYPEIKMALSRTIMPQLICLGLVILIVWQIAAGMVSFYLLEHSKNHNPIQEVEKKSEMNPLSLNHGLRTPFFGEYIPTNLNDANIKQSMLNLSLVGIIFAVNEEDSQIIIRTATGQEQVYHVGDSLPGGVIIKRITSEGVLLGRAGTLESLSLPKNKLIFEQPPKPLIGD